VGAAVNHMCDLSEWLTLTPDCPRFRADRIRPYQAMMAASPIPRPSFDSFSPPPILRISAYLYAKQ